MLAALTELDIPPKRKKGRRAGKGPYGSGAAVPAGGRAGSRVRQDREARDLADEPDIEDELLEEVDGKAAPGSDEEDGDQVQAESRQTER